MLDRDSDPGDAPSDPALFLRFTVGEFIDTTGSDVTDMCSSSSSAKNIRYVNCKKQTEE